MLNFCADFLHFQTEQSANSVFGIVSLCSCTVVAINLCLFCNVDSLGCRTIIVYVMRVLDTKSIDVSTD